MLKIDTVLCTSGTQARGRTLVRTTTTATTHPAVSSSRQPPAPLAYGERPARLGRWRWSTPPPRRRSSSASSARALPVTAQRPTGNHSGRTEGFGSSLTRMHTQLIRYVRSSPRGRRRLLLLTDGAGCRTRWMRAVQGWPRPAGSISCVQYRLQLPASQRDQKKNQETTFHQKENQINNSASERI
jgi:hypothetical protein